ncbi:MAG: late competence development ComFB family protein [Thiomicrospira sp.]|uniref:late competence development ComFB family protein n=1 Tax=Thiomicrospira sp. TaxID=935 RepID=UPI0019E5136D|nr:late competence development ComFB family protein [Thiomicrospira sp.]MBE0494148.1 late competence development ComFB family protein [Thiomicrospira sp.]
MAFDSVHNYYEKLVFDEINQFYANEQFSEDELEDMACLALNKIQPRYIRHNVDMCFFMTEDDRMKIVDAIKDAVAYAHHKITSHHNRTA